MAIQEFLPLLTTKGQVISQTPSWKKTTLKGKIRLRRGQTFFARHGDCIGRISLIFGGDLILYARIQKFRRNSTTRWWPDVSVYGQANRAK
jgi:hypothetical protein